MRIDKVLNIDVSELVTLNTGERMTLYEASRWALLMRGVDVIDEKARQLKVNLDDENWVKPLALQKFVDEQTPSMIAEIKTLKDKKPDSCTIL